MRKLEFKHVIKPSDVCDLLNETKYKDVYSWWPFGYRAWTAKRIFPLLKDAGLIEYEFSKGDSQVVRYGVIPHGTTITVETIEKLLEGKNYRKCPEMTYRFK